MRSMFCVSALRSLQELADPARILWGSDLPFVYGERLRDEVEHWEKYDGIDATARAAIEELNSVNLFPRFAPAGAELKLNLNDSDGR